MEDRIVVDFNALDRIARKLNTAGSDLDAAMSILSSAQLTSAGGAYLRLNGAGLSLKSVGGSVSAGNVTQVVQNYRSALKRISEHSRSLSSAVSNTAAAFRQTETGLTGGVSTASTEETASASEEGSASKSSFSWSTLWKFVGEAGIIGSLIAAGGELITGGRSDMPKSVMKALKYLLKGGGSIAKGISKATASNSSFDWKRLIGLQTAVTKDSPTTYFAALKEEALKYSFGNAKNTWDKVAVGCKWAGSILTVATTAYDNFHEEGNSTGRAIGETIIESAVHIGGGMLIGAGVAAVLVGAPAVVTGVVTVGVTLGLNKLCEAITGKDIAENVSDFVIDKIGSAVSNFVEDVGTKVGNAVSSVGKTISSWWQGITGHRDLSYASSI